MLNETPRRIPTIGFVSLGCAKALVDSERVITELRSEGYSIVDNYRDSDLVIVNTCGFINEAIEESLGAIAEATRENGRVIVMGCLGGKKDADGTNFVMKRNPAVLGVLGPEEEKDVVKLVHQHLPAPHAPYLDLVPGGGVRLTPQHYAYLKISEGCNNHCTFCIIPQLRGKTSDVASKLIALVERKKRYPKSARRSGTEGVLEITFSLSPAGKILKASVSKGSGFSVLDAAGDVLASALIGESVGETGRAMKITVPLRYSLKNS